MPQQNSQHLITVPTLTIFYFVKRNYTFCCIALFVRGKTWLRPFRVALARVSHRRRLISLEINNSRGWQR